MEREIEEAGGYTEVDMKYMEDIRNYLKVRVYLCEPQNICSTANHK